MSKENYYLKDIQWFMLDKKRYFPLTMVNMIAVRTLLYPLTLVRTRLQVQTRRSLYTGTLNALRTIVKYEGFSSLYKGYLINCFQFAPHVLYITTYEKVRQQVSHLTSNLYVMAFVGGAAGSLFAQMFSVPLDIVSQHMMLVGQKSPVDLDQTAKQQMKMSSANLAAKSAAPKISEIDRILVPESVRRLSTLAVARFIATEIYKNER